MLYPDSAKIGVRTEKGGLLLFPLAAAVPYWSGEPVPPTNTAAVATTVPAPAMKLDSKAAAAPTATTAAPATSGGTASGSGSGTDSSSSAVRPKWILNESSLTPTSWADMRKPLFDMPNAAISDNYAFKRWRF